MAVFVISTIQQLNNAPFPIVEDVDLKAGFRVVANTTERDNIHPSFRREGMLVRVGNGTVYELESDLTTWSVYTGVASVEVEVYDTIVDILAVSPIPPEGTLGYVKENNTLYIVAGVGSPPVYNWNAMSSAGLADSLEGVSNPGGNIDMIGTNGIVITGNDIAKTITVDLDSVDGGVF